MALSGIAKKLKWKRETAGRSDPVKWKEKIARNGMEEIRKEMWTSREREERGKEEREEMKGWIKGLEGGVEELKRKRQKRREGKRKGIKGEWKKG
jgi:hypothetical protein